MKNKTPASKISASVLVTIGVIVLSYLLLPKLHSIGAARTMPRKNTDAAARAADKRARMALGGLPLSFEMNRGQFDGQVKFASRGAGYKAFLTQSETVFVLRKPGAKKAADKNLLEKTKGATRAERLAERKRLRAERAAERAASKSVVRMSLAGGNVAPQVSGMDELPGKINYFRGRDQQKWITDVPTFHRVHFASVYPGIDLVYYGQGRQLEYDFVVAPGADASQIGFDFEGAERVEVDPGTGGLVVHAAGGAQLRQGKPVFYQESNGGKQPISGGFTVSGNRAGFTIGDYDKTRPLVIDPVVFTYSTYLGAEDNDRGHDIVADADGNAYAAGWTESEEFPTKDAVQPGNNDDTDEAFITKFNPGGYALIWSTYLGGGDTGNEGGADEGAYGVALDAARNVYVTGFTFSRDFPTKDAMQPQLSDACCDSDSFITKIAASGNQLVFSTYFGGSDGTDVGRGIAVDSNNNVYVTGYTNSFVFPTTNPIQREINGRTTHQQSGEDDERYDAYLAKIDASGQFRVYSTYIGGHLDDVALGVAVDSLGYAYVTGWTDSTEVDPSATPEPNRIEEFTIPQPFFRPGFIAVGPDSQIYFGDVDAQIPGRLGRLNIQPDPTATPTFEQFTFDPSEGFDGCQSVGDMTTNPFPSPSPSPAPDANSIYFQDSCNYRLGRIDTSGNATDLTGPISSGCTSQITNNPDGNIYYTDSCSSRFFRYNPNAGTNTEFGSSCGATYGITTGPDGNIYILDSCGQIEKVDPGTGSVINSYFTGQNFGNLSTITSGPDGNLYFTTGNSNSPVIGQFNPTLGSLTFFNIPTGHAAQGITAGPDGHIYFTMTDGHRIGRLEIATGTIREFGLPTCDARPRDIVAGPDGNLYFTEEDTVKIGRYKLNPLTPDPAPLNCPPDPLFPITQGAFQQNPGGSGFTRDAFVTKVAADGSQYIYSTFLGGADEDVGWGVAVGSDRSAFVTGYTDSGAPTAPQRTNGPTPTPIPLQNDFPTTPNAFQPQNNGGYDAFLSRLDPNGSSLIYSTYIGGDQNEGEGDGECLSCGDRIDGAAVAVDFSNNAYITGWTESTFVDDPGDGPNEPAPFINFPIKDAAQPDPGSSPGSFGSEARDAFVCKFNTDASGDDSLVYSTFLGGSHQDEGEGIAVDPAANAYVTGWTLSGSDCAECPTPLLLAEALNDFPTTAGAFQEEPSDRDDGFVAKIAGGGFTIIGEGQGFIISGKVTLADDGSPVAGVTITLERPDGTMDPPTVTDTNGIYSFSNVAPAPEDPYTVTPSGDPYIYTPPSQEVIIVNQNQRADFVASLPPEPTPTPTPEPTATPTATPTSPASQALNLSTRLHVLIGDQVGIGGFIISGAAPKHVIVRAIGPDLSRFGIPNPLPDPVLELHGSGTFQTITNNNWRDTQEAQIKASGIPPTNDLESAIDIILEPGTYTGIIRGNGGSTGIGLIEVYDLDTAAASKLSNISTRGFVGSTPGDAIIAGFILGNSSAPDRMVVRGLGPSLTSNGVPNALQNPTLELHNGDGALLVTNNDWKDNPTNAAEIVLAGLAPSDDRESAIAITLTPGVYTAILGGLQNTTGNGLVEIYDRGAAP